MRDGSFNHASSYLVAFLDTLLRSPSGYPQISFHLPTLRAAVNLGDSLQNDEDNDANGASEDDSEDVNDEEPEGVINIVD